MDDLDISTARLRLRCLEPSDAGWIAREIANPKVHCWLTSPPCPYTLADARDFISMFAQNPAYRVIERDQEPLGVVSISDTFELGYWLKEAAWGQGIMSEASTAMLSWHWSRSDEALNSGWVVGNKGSSQILTQLGFAADTQKERYVEFFGEPRPVERVALAAPHRPLFTCHTERLVLNAVTLEDLPVIHAQFGKPEIARMLSSVAPSWTAKQARAWLTERLTPTREGFGRAIRLKDGTFIGSVGAGGTPLNLGYMLAPAYWGQGYMTETLRAFLPAAVAHWGDVDEVTATVFTDNPASMTVLERLGFIDTGESMGESRARAEPTPMRHYRWEPGHA